MLQDVLELLEVADVARLPRRPVTPADRDEVRHRLRDDGVNDAARQALAGLEHLAVDQPRHALRDLGVQGGGGVGGRHGGFIVPEGGALETTATGTDRPRLGPHRRPGARRCSQLRR